MNILSLHSFPSRGLCIDILVLVCFFFLHAPTPCHALECEGKQGSLYFSGKLPGMAGLLATSVDRSVSYSDVMSRRIKPSVIKEKKVFGAKILLATSVAVTVYSLIRMEDKWNECDWYEALSVEADGYSDAIEYYRQAKEFHKSGRRYRSIALGGVISGGLIRYFMWRCLDYDMSSQNVIGY